jgi:hypothetical protein
MGLLKNKKFKDLNLMELTPVRNYEHIENEKGLIDVLVPRFTDWFFGKLLMPRMKKKYIKANLDEIGSVTWLLIDGDNKVYQISDKLSDHFGEKVEPTVNRITLFMHQLYRNGFITFKEIRKD